MNIDDVIANVAVAGGGCLEWKGALDGKGYGNVNVRGKFMKAHRAAWIHAHGPIEGGLCVLHKCDNPPCINPTHLFLGTKKDNSDDMMAKGRGRKALGSGHGNAKLTEECVRRMREAYLYGAKQIDLAPAYGVNQGLVSAIVLGKTWKHVGGASSL